MTHQFKCKTTAQFKAYQWIKKNFNLEFVNISINDSNSLVIKDNNDRKAIVSYHQNKITLNYDDGTKEVYKIKSIEPCR